MNSSIIQKIAHELFIEKTDSLEYQLTNEECFILSKEKSCDYYINNNILFFSSYESRDKYIVKHYCQTINSSEVNTNENIIKIAIDIWHIGIRGEYSTAGLFLSQYEDKIDIWHALIQFSRKHYETTSLVDQYLKHTRDIEVKKVFKLFSEIHNKFNGQVGFFSLFSERLTGDTSKCYEIINEFYLNINSEHLPLYNMALFSLPKKDHPSVINILLSDIAKNNSTLSPQALWILGRFIEKNDIKNRKNSIKSILKNKISSSIINISSAAIQATINAAEKIPELYPIIYDLLNASNTKAITFLCHKIVTTKTLQSHPDFPYWINTICANSEEDIELRAQIYHILSLLSTDESKHQLLIHCLFTMIRNGSAVNNSKEIESFLHSAMRQNDLANKIYTLALTDNTPETAEFSRLLSNHLIINNSNHLLEYNTPIINDFTDNDFVFLVRRTLGFISNEQHLMSSLLSLLHVENAHKRTCNLVFSVIANELAMDYPNYVIDEIQNCKNKIKDKKILKTYDDIIAHTNNYLNSLKKYPRIKEFEPPSSHTLSFQKERDRVMAKNQEIANEDSFVFKIAATIKLKAGTASFYYNDHFNTGYSEPSYLCPFSSSYSLPRRYVMDNIGYEIRTMMFKTAKKDVI